MLSILLSIPVSVGLLVWMARMKKMNPFPKYTFVKLLIAGVLAGVISAFLSLLGGFIALLIEIGPEQFKLLLNAETAQQVLDSMNNTSQAVTVTSVLLGLVRTFLLVGFAEEIAKYFGAKIVMRKKGVVHTWLDALICFAVVAVGFQLSEDISYSAGSIGIAIFRSLTPFHFTFAVIVGYFYGLGKVKGKGAYTALGIFIASFLHTVYDFSINLLKRTEDFAFLALFMIGFMFILTVLAILKLRKWHKNGSLDIPIV